MSDDDIKVVVESFGCQLVNVFFVRGVGKIAYFAVADANAKHHALDMVYKIKKLYTNGTHVEINPLADLTPEQLNRRAIEVYARITERLGRASRNRGGGGKEGKK